MSINSQDLKCFEVHVLLIVFTVFFPYWYLKYVKLINFEITKGRTIYPSGTQNLMKFDIYAELFVRN